MKNKIGYRIIFSLTILFNVVSVLMIFVAFFTPISITWIPIFIFIIIVSIVIGMKYNINIFESKNVSYLRKSFYKGVSIRK